ncbi:CDP-alcohol phosphatidyltransferase family protein [Flavobacterium sp.]|jgi:CDP-diacylglycerol--serine O-phosphatidyltransferase|uniref:CDP-alcohol phosphatidyltransferase family protein n=1 Tax=Flavobacterium sp. TaxID=239 RepID=UPI0037BF8C89
MSIKKHIPNAITLLNLLAGLLALIHVFNGNYNEAFSLVCLGIFFDYWDGFFARIWKVQSPIGLQLDSLADMVTSGVVPGFVMYKMLADIQENQSQYNLTEDTYYMGIVPYLGFLITLASCYRLAKFNVDTRQTDSFIGLPTPANALLIMSIPMIQFHSEFEWLVDFLSNPFVLVGVTVLSSYLLNAEIPLFSLKVKSFSWEKYKMQVVFIIISVILIAILEFIAIPIIILFYVILSVVNNTIFKKV